MSHNSEVILSLGGPRRGHPSRSSRYRLVTMGGRAFSCAAPALWDDLPASVRKAISPFALSSLLKTHIYDYIIMNQHQMVLILVSPAAAVYHSCTLHVQPLSGTIISLRPTSHLAAGRDNGAIHLYTTTTTTATSTTTTATTTTKKNIVFHAQRDHAMHKLVTGKKYQCNQVCKCVKSTLK